MGAMDEAKQAALVILEAGLANGDSPINVLNNISAVWDGDPMELIDMLV